MVCPGATKTTTATTTTTASPPPLPLPLSEAVQENESDAHGWYVKGRIATQSIWYSSPSYSCFSCFMTLFVGLMYVASS